MTKRSGAELKGTAASCLADVAPTILAVMGVEKPKEMEGQDLTV